LVGLGLLPLLPVDCDRASFEGEKGCGCGRERGVKAGPVRPICCAARIAM
jgi:hypothetical protein